MINYSDEEQHTATVKQHITQLIDDLRNFCDDTFKMQEYLDAAYYIKEVGEMLDVLRDKNLEDNITITWRDWAGFITKDEEK